MRLSVGASLLYGFALAHRILGVESDGVVANEPPPVNKNKDTPMLYIVQLDSSPVIEHSDTKPGRNRKLDVTDERVQEYIGYLESEQDEVVQTIGGQKVHSYLFGFNGFTAYMTPAEAQALASQSNVLKVWEDEVRELETDGTHEFIGLAGPGEAWSLGYTGEDVVIGIIDGGIHPEHLSFADTPTPINGNTGNKVPYGDVPATFNGTECAFGNQEYNADDAPFECNNKLISAKCFVASQSNEVDASLPCGGDGARLESDEFLSARDSNDHGSHVASTAAGNYGVEAIIEDEIVANITGMAPRARLAVYKVCWTHRFGRGCSLSDIMAGIDEAIKDGVDVVNYSLGGSNKDFDNPDDIAFLRAADAGIYVTTSTGNAGPDPGTVGTPGGIPWITAVGSAQDDGINGAELVIESPADISDTYFAIEANSPVQLPDLGGIVSGDIVPAIPLNACSSIQNNLTDKIALVIRGGCSYTMKFNNVNAAGAKSIIVFNDGTRSDRQNPNRMAARNTTIPGIMISYNDGKLLNETATPDNETGVAETIIGSAKSISLENIMSSSSSRGPNLGALDILKPDVVAPGVGILAAGTPFNSGGRDDGEIFEIKTGTSMASPHVAGLFALLKQVHPDWSPAMVRSAIMTTARQDIQKSRDGEAADPFDMGSGFIVPQNAFDPGLAFDVGLSEYEAFLCGLNNVVEQSRCDELSALGLSFHGSQLNYPSIAISDMAGKYTVTRTVTSVANTTAEETFTAFVEPPPGYTVSVVPSTISLLPGATAKYKVTLTTTESTIFDEWAFGSMTWSNGGGNLRKSSTYSVRSPIAVKSTYFSFPSTVFGSGSTVGSRPSGSISFDIGFGFAGSYTAGIHGLAKPILLEGSVDDDPSENYRFPNGQGVKRFTFEFAAGTILARFALLDEFTSGEDDLDLYVWACPEGRETINNNICAFVGSSSKSRSSSESVDVPFPKEAFGVYGTYYIVDVHGFRTDNRDTATFTLLHWKLGSDDDFGNMVVNAAPTLAVPGLANITVSWPDVNQLDSGAVYVGAVTHTGPTGVLGLTTIEIDS